MNLARSTAPDTAPGRLLVALSALPGVTPGHDRVPLRRLQRAAGRWLAREASARLTGYSPDGFVIGGGGDARPRLAQSPPGAPALVIGITHSGSWAGAAAGMGLTAIGIDIQEDVPRPAARLAEFMRWTKLLAGSDGGSAVGPDEFTQLWTLWEAAVKCDGAALLTRSTPAFDALSPLCVPATDWCGATGGYWAASRRLAPGYWLSVVACGDAPVAPAVTIHRLPFDPAAPDQG